MEQYLNKPENGMTVIDEGDHLGVFDALDDTDAYTEFLKHSTKLDELIDAEETLYDKSTLDRDMVASIESSYPGMVIDNVRFSERYTEEGYTACVEALGRKKDIVLSNVASAALGVITQLQVMVSKINKIEKDGRVDVTLDKMNKSTKRLVMPKDVISESKLIMAYETFLGFEPRDAKEVGILVKKIQDYKNPVMCLMDYPSKHYNRLFSALLGNTVADNQLIFKSFDKMNNRFTDEIVNNIHDTQNMLTDIINSGDHAQLSRFTKELIPRDVHRTLSDIVSALDIKVSSKHPILNQASSIGRQVAKKRGTAELTSSNKNNIIRTIVDNHGSLDKAFNDVTQATNRLTQLGSKDSEELISITTGLKKMRGERTTSDKLKQTVSVTGRQASQQYKRIIREINDLWKLVNLFTRLSISYVYCYSDVKVTLDKFSLRLLVFTKTVSDLQPKGE